MIRKSVGQSESDFAEKRNDEREDKDKEIRERILTGAEELFLQYGFRSITMDEIAKHLGVSKKTIYQHFADKDEIVCHCIENHLDYEKCTANEIWAKVSNPVEEFVIEAQHLKFTTHNIHPTILFELKKYHPKAWAIFQEHKEKWILQSIIDNLKKGMEMGFYRSDIDPDILARLRVEQIAMGFDPTIFPGQEFVLKKIQLQLLEHFLHGILSDKGREFLNLYLQTINEQ
ncbi:TetR/AcrR family transcriptional regulator [Cytophagaceae bacterium DM2B3-1]|uniref:TetR/AcrR family transcriptional regulator n=2 Tax=Xanthocytophaga TaxID=3078918 RepID=A0AAE3U749_9BACT|nr:MULTISPECIES: TetR/AcrR family transcriptional regulator [Xanthocytophaga]MDJ1468017.1 TetR/AcrR family transcriptional regulator [Xanthocytophaga flavus]MDJ1481232.1 TetR/AcrR family transcriptional regulator [Xanthocytophaga flavus]MDJ1495911.1 TetR/AcrR family transcriptional regulator [Xanthocytophaga flavus]MDJ1502251.1 TetR/AcrR family transcriptional regulator [Xanthocytophaga agilis]